MLEEGQSPSNNLLRQLLVGADPASVRNCSDLADVNCTPRRTFSVSASSWHSANWHLGETVRRRRFSLSERLNRRFQLQRGCLNGRGRQKDSPRRCLNSEDGKCLPVRTGTELLADGDRLCVASSEDLPFRVKAQLSDLGFATGASPVLLDLLRIWLAQVAPEAVKATESTFPRSPQQEAVISSPLVQLLESTAATLPNSVHTQLRDRLGRKNDSLWRYVQILERFSPRQESTKSAENQQILDLSTTTATANGCPLRSEVDLEFSGKRDAEHGLEDVARRYDHLSNSPSLWPVRLAPASTDSAHRLVLKYLLAADAYFSEHCQGVPQRVLLNSALNHRYCRCHGDAISRPQLDGTLSLMLQRLWASLLITYMIEGNFEFTVVPLSASESERLLVEARTSDNFRDLEVVRLGTVHSLLSLIRSGNQVTLSPETMQAVRKCILAQCAYPNYFCTSHRIAIKALLESCNVSSGDCTLFSAVLLMLNEINSISPEALHCLFSIGQLGVYSVSQSEPGVHLE